nr:gustatory receptor [Fopius arisanus]
MRKPSNFLEAIWPVQTLKIMLGCEFYVDFSRPIVTCLCICLTILMWILYWIALYFVCKFITDGPWFSFEEKFFLIMVYVQNCILFVNLLIEFAYQRSRSRDAMKWIHVDETLQLLGANIDYWRMFTHQLLMMSLWLIQTLIINFIGTFCMEGNVNFLKNLMIVVMLYHSIHVNYLLEFFYAMPIRQIDLRFQIINTILETVLANCSGDGFFLHKRNCLAGKYFSVQIMQDDTPSPTAVMQITRHVHLELTNFAKQITQRNAAKLTMSIAETFIVLTLSLYLAFLELLASSG